MFGTVALSWVSSSVQKYNELLNAYQKDKKIAEDEYLELLNRLQTEKNKSTRLEEKMQKMKENSPRMGLSPRRTLHVSMEDELRDTEDLSEALQRDSMESELNTIKRYVFREILQAFMTIHVDN